MICVLRVIDGPAQGSQLWITRNQCLVIGRMSTADFSIPADPHLSRNHLFVEGGENYFHVRDNGSRNGTYVNNAPVSSIELHSGDVIRAGKTIFEVTLKDELNRSKNANSADPLTVPRRMLSATSDVQSTEKYEE